MSVDVGTDTFTELMTEMNPSTPCEIGEVVDKINRCHEVAKWIVFWRESCENGSKIEGDKANVLCARHKEFLLVEMNRVILVCSGCGLNIHGLGHIINRVEGL